jgi:hypothetical protein
LLNRKKGVSKIEFEAKFADFLRNSQQKFADSAKLKLKSCSAQNEFAECSPIPIPKGGHSVTTFLSAVPQKKSLISAVMQRIASGSTSFPPESTEIVEGEYGDCRGGWLVCQARGSLAATLGMSIDFTAQEAPSRKRGNSAPPVQSHNGTTLLREMSKKKSLLLTVMKRVGSFDDFESSFVSLEGTKVVEEVGVAFNAGSLATALGMRINPTARAAPICKTGHSAPPVPPHNGTTLLPEVPKRKSLFSTVMERIASSQDDSDSSFFSSDGTESDEEVEAVGSTTSNLSSFRLLVEK